jgi:hypothetical protein
VIATEKGIEAAQLVLEDMVQVLIPFLGPLEGCVDPLVVQRAALRLADGINLVRHMLNPDSKFAPFVEAQGPEWVRQGGVKI